MPMPPLGRAVAWNRRYGRFPTASLELQIQKMEDSGRAPGKGLVEGAGYGDYAKDQHVQKLLAIRRGTRGLCEVPSFARCMRAVKEA